MPLPSGVCVFVVQVGLEPAVLAAHRGQPLVEGDPHVVFGEHLEVAGVVDPADIGGQNPFRRDEFDVRTGAGQYLCGVQAWMLTVVVVEQHVALGPERSTQHVPAVGYEMSDPSARNSVLGTPPVATMTRSGSSASTSSASA